jgi:hypothetical protein
MTDPQTTDVRPRCRYPKWCEEEFCDCDLTPEDIEIIDRNLRHLDGASNA